MHYPTLAIDPAQMRQTLGRFPTGVVVVTAQGRSGPAGMTLQSFMSLSLDPPLILLAVARTSKSWPEIATAGRFAVNILAEDQAGLARQFARSGSDKFGGVGHRTADLTGAPLLKGVIAWIECELHSVHPGGDHDVVVARVLDLGVAEESSAPLLFCRSAFPRLEK
ncbi:flavin reductase family protein [Arthrobacter sp. I2-34]|uniref:Flavin reductase family protein n=1 Tax=Arthrobacter hankyongi TaxID=2904801 RepID=A0ABS9L7F7_9MICC|nr:flavin reductase family protein [Arthrobacter hankyongi]MCG2622599.1 flavin reductase family protein [Arthrobacter hankyongi]